MKRKLAESGEIGVIRVNGDEATVKKFVRNDNLIQLIPLSDNKDYLPQVIDINKKEIEIVGKVKMAIKKYS